MKKLLLSLSIAAIGLSGFAASASAQRYQERLVEARIDGPRISIGRGRDGRTAEDLRRLNREVQIVRHEIRSAGLAGRRVRGDFFRVMRATERLNEQYRRGDARGWEIRRRADGIRSELHQIRRELRFRTLRPVGWR